MIIGLTGGTGSGKSTVAEILRSYGYTVVDADKVSREVTEKGSEALKELSEYFGDDILYEDGSLNRKLLRERAFASDEALAVLQKSVTDRIIQISKERLKDDFSLYDAPTLLENKLQYLVDTVIVVTARKELRIRRIMERDKISRKKVLEIMDRQMPDREKVKYADIVIKNNGTKDELR